MGVARFVLEGGGRFGENDGKHICGRGKGGAVWHRDMYGELHLTRFPGAVVHRVLSAFSNSYNDMVVLASDTVMFTTWEADVVVLSQVQAVSLLPLPAGLARTRG